MDKNENAVHYVDNDQLLADMLEFREARQKNPNHRIPNSIGAAILKIAQNVPKHPNFAKFKPIRDAMTSQIVENCCRYINNWDPAIKKNPFGYFSSIAFYACMKVIGEEKYEFLIKHEAQRKCGLENFLDALASSGSHDDFESIEEAYGQFANRAPQREMTFGVKENWPEEKRRPIHRKKKKEKPIEEEMFTGELPNPPDDVDAGIDREEFFE